MSTEVEVPTCVSGGITVAHPSLCMDGATHLIHTSLIGTIRLVPTNSAVKKALEKFENTKVMVTVCGYPRQSANCTHMEVYHAGIAEELASKLLELS